MTATSTATQADHRRWASPTKECDLIMKGGITSGVIYPRAACQLAETYRFRQVGGASAGAIAAAFVAAAELGRNRSAPAGFAGLEEIADDLGSNLSTLFQPTKATKGAFGILTAWIEPEWGTFRKVAVTMWRLLRHAPVVAVVVFVVAMTLGVVVGGALQHGADWRHWWTPRLSWLVWVPGAFLFAVIAAAAATAVKTSRSMTANGFGLCNGHIGTDPHHQPLTDWMSDTLDALAERTRADGPLLFGHLWGPDPNDKAIDLQVMTTCLTLRRPYRFPFATDVFFACPMCMRTYFPESVVAALFPSAGPAKQDDADWTCPLHPDQKVRHLPPAEYLPVVVAARISLSFPGLISAIPLCYVDHSRPPGKQNGVVAWFSDGGIASNFPMHFFDRLWPRRPTFGINLQPTDPDYPDMVWRATTPKQGLLPRVHPVTSLGQFVRGILDTMQNWNDTTQLTLPGFRDRVVEVRTTNVEGGMNLKMKPGTIKDLTDRGQDAAKLLETFDFELHRWIRYRVAMNLLDGTLTTLLDRYGPTNQDVGYQAFLADYGPRASSYKMSQNQLASDGDATQALMDVAANWGAAGHPAAAGETPNPEPALRLVPPQ
jgi:predicted acylesterase/phospholipase RssA